MASCLTESCGGGVRATGAALAVLMLVAGEWPVAAAHAGRAPAGDQCLLSYDPTTDWGLAFVGMKSLTADSFENVPACDPIALAVEAEHWVVLDERCECTVPNNRWIELSTNVRYEWALAGGGGYFTPLANDTSLALRTTRAWPCERHEPGLANDTSLGSAKPTTQQVLWHPPDLNPDDQMQVTIHVTAFNEDEEEKPVPLALTGTFTIQVQRKAVVLSTELPDGATLLRELQRNDYQVQFSCNPRSGGGGLEQIQTCEPQWHWEEGSEIDGDFTAPSSSFLRGDFIVLSATGTDTDALEMWCTPYASACIPSPTTLLELPDTLRFEWSSSLGMSGENFPAKLKLDGPPSLQHASNPRFPTWDVYLGSDGVELSKIAHKSQESALKFIDRGGKENEYGP